MDVYIKDFHYWFSMLSLGALLFSIHKIIYGLVINMPFFSPPSFFFFLIVCLIGNILGWERQILVDNLLSTPACMGRNCSHMHVHAVS